MEPDGTRMTAMMSNFGITSAVSNNSREAGCSQQQNGLAQLQSGGTANAPINYLSPVITSNLEGIRFYCLTHERQSLDCTSSVA